MWPRNPKIKGQPWLWLFCLLSFSTWAQLPEQPQFYQYQVLDKEAGLPQLTALDMVTDHKGFTWIATTSGLSRFDGRSLVNFLPGSDKFPAKSGFIRNLFNDSHNNLWVGTQNGLLVKKWPASAFSRLDSFDDKVIWSVNELGDGTILVGAQDGLYEVNPASFKVEDQVSISNVKQVMPYQGGFLVATYDKGLLSLNRAFEKTGEELRFGLNINKVANVGNSVYVASELGFFDFKKPSQPLFKAPTYDFRHDGSQFKLATEEGLIQLNGQDKPTFFFKGKSWTFVEDNKSLLLGTHSNGVIIFKKNPSALTNQTLPSSSSSTYVKFIAHSGKDVLLIDNKANAYIYNGETIKPLALDDGKVNYLFDSANGYLILTSNGLVVQDRGQTQTIVSDIAFNSAIYQENWILSDRNHNYYHLEAGHIIRDGGFTSCNPGFTNHLYKFKGVQYLAGDNGLCQKELSSGKEVKIVDTWTKKVVEYKNRLYALLKDGRIIDIASGEVLQLPLKPSEEIYSGGTVAVASGERFVTLTSSGFKVFDVQGDLLHLGIVASFDSRYNILDEYASTAFMISPSGTLYLGGIGGITLVDVGSVPHDSPSGDITVSGVNLFGDERNDLLGELLKTHSLTLEYHQYPLFLDLSLLNSEFPDRASFQYKVSSYDDRWYDLDNSNRLALSKLDSGTHKITFRAIDGGRVVAQSQGINLVILPPWWRSNGAIFVYICIVFFIALHILSIVRTRRRQHARIVESEERLKLALWGSGDELWDWDIENGNIYRSNIWDTLLLPDDGVRTADNKNNIYPKDLARVKSTLNACFSGEQDEFEIAYRVKGKEDDWVWILDRGRVVEYNDRGAPVRMTGTIKNISKLKKTEEKLKLLAQSFRNISDAICITSPDFIIQDINDSFTRITGTSRQDAIGKPWNFSLYNERFMEQIKQALEKSGRWHDELEARRNSGEIYPIEITIDRVMDDEKDSFHFVAVFSDISERKEKERELERLTNTDPLTGLPNRSFFMSTLHGLVRKKQPCALMVLDLNNFKQVNDSLGHQYGDQLLLEVADRLQYVMGQEHTLYRLGGDEFAIVVDSQAKLDDITRLSAALHRQLMAPFYLHGEEINVTCAIGAVLYPDDGDNPENLLRNADAAMYHAKHVGGDICQFFSTTMNEQAHARLALENRVRKALRENLFEVFYQPKADTYSGQCKGAEALLRLPDGRGGYISPADFIPIAEESGLIVDLGNWVMHATCRQVCKWYDQGLFPGRIAINLSPRQFRQQDLVARIDEVLETCGLPPHLLELELTEGAMMEDPIRAIAVMERLRERGITLAMDDFGTGYSSLSHLRQFPVTSVKIDRSFVKDLTVDTSARSLTAAIISLAKNMELQVVAEGVETEEQLTALKQLNCPISQGYLFGKPMPAMDFEQLLLKRGGKLGPADVVSLKR